MHWQKYCRLIPFILLLLGASGCGSFMAHRMVESPNRYPTWFAPEAPVLLGFHPNVFTNIAKKYITVGPPEARLCYRVVEPADYAFRVESTNWTEGDFKRTAFDFQTDLPARTNAWTGHPRGTVVLIHGYALAQFCMMPWALKLAEDGWRCVLVDLRGHGKSTGKKIYYGIREPCDLSQLLDALARTNQLLGPVAAIGESYGAVMALRWEAADPRVRTVVAITPYGSLSNAVMNLRTEYADWLPPVFTKAGLRKLPMVLGTTAAELDTATVLARMPESALFIASDGDKIAPPEEVQGLYRLATSDSRLIVVPGSTHETVTYRFGELGPPVIEWLEEKAK